MYPHMGHQYGQHGQQPAADWRTQPPAPLPSIQYMAAPGLLPGMHAPNGMNGYQTGYMPPQGYYHGNPDTTQMPPQLPPQPMPQEVHRDCGARPMELSHSGSNDKFRFTLVVEQQPKRARMCGFGDKDRRPITPPPCVRLLIHDLRGKEVDVEHINGSFFVLQVDLWNEKADREANVVRASSTASPSASISTATTTSFPPISDRGSTGGMMYGAPQPMNNIGQLPGLQFGYPAMPPSQQPPNNTMFTRNLIGSLTVNAAKLTDDKGKAGYWFVLQDLSVRTEGHFRLRMNFIDVGIVTAASTNGGPSLNRGRAPVLAHVFSDPFQVYSAKKFPGVIESTELSKTFARQGVKIPIRKETKEGKDEDDDD